MKKEWELNKWEKWVLIVCLVGLCAVSFIQFEQESFKDAIKILSDWMYNQMVVSVAPVTPNLAIRERKAQVSDIVATIYKLESSGGKNDPCVRDGLGYNGFGYKPGTCYDSHDRVQGYVTDWVSSLLDQGYSEAELLCYYNLGKPKGTMLKDCTYYQNYLALN